MKTNKLTDLISEFYRINYSGVAKDWTCLVSETLDVSKEQERLDILLKHIPLTKSMKILELGSGFGNFLTYMRSQGYNIIGMEPDELCGQIISERLKSLQQNSDYIKGSGESIPLPDNSMDCIVSFQVLEHVQDVEKTLAECARILKSKGYLHLVAPNYGSFWEPHYATVFPMFLGKPIYRLYLKLLGRNLNFLDSLQFITSKKINNSLKDLNFKILDDGKSLFKQRMTFKNMPKWGQTKTLSLIVKTLNLLKINSMIANTLTRLDMHYPINISAQKN